LAVDVEAVGDLGRRHKPLSPRNLQVSLQEFNDAASDRLDYVFVERRPAAGALLEQVGVGIHTS
jgi:hypothetical protein